MIRNLKMMGLALVAMMALGAVLASSAFAQFEAEKEPVTLTTSSNEMQKFAPTAGGTAFECTTLTISANTPKTKASETLEVHPTYSNCETFLGAAMSITTTGCNYVFHLKKGETKGTTDVECEAGKKIVIKMGSICTYEIGTQTGLGSITYKNVGAGTTREVIVEPNLGGVTWTRITNDFFCPAGGSTGTYVGNSTITGENAAGTEHIGVFVD